ncbi:MAG: DUF4255 domain-containing protein [Lyngbya sp.]|nr:DUF4255 domain-containing protein [Lyngbya sp.]
MSNYLAIATVTAILQQMLQTGIANDVPGARVTTIRPDNAGGGVPDTGINIFLYQASPNPAWRNADLRTRRPKDNLIKQAQAGLDLYYLLTFYGNEQELEPQRLLGSAIQTIVDQPIITPEMIGQVINSNSFPFLTASTLDEQVQLVQFIPVPMTTEELSRLWSIFFQLPYSLSFGFQATAVLIEGRKPGKAPLPVRSRQFYAVPNQPMIEQIEPSNGINQPITANSTLNIRGKQLLGEQTRIHIGGARVIPQDITDTQITLDISALSSQEFNSLRAGLQGLQVVHFIRDRLSSNSNRTLESNVIPLILRPTITINSEEINFEEIEDNLYSGEIEIQVDLRVGFKQRVFLLLNGISDQNSQSYIFSAKRRTRNSHILTFSLENIKLGDYLVRMQIDGAESLLTVDNDRYSGPILHVL